MLWILFSSGVLKGMERKTRKRKMCENEALTEFFGLGIIEEGDEQR